MSVLLTGPGAGAVTSTPAGIDCRSGGAGGCEAEFTAGTQVTLTAEADAGFSFGAWSGDGTGETQRSVTMDGARSVSAEFLDPTPPELHVPGDHATIQAAIDAAEPGEEIVVAPGTYVGTIDFRGKGIVLRGTDPLDPDVVAATILDGGGDGPVVRIATVTSGHAILMGFTIQNGVADMGGGIYIEDATPTLINLVVRNNFANLRGGGMAAVRARYPLPDPAASAQGSLAVAGRLEPGAVLPYQHYHCGIDPRARGPVQGCIHFNENGTGGLGGGFWFDDSQLHMMMVDVDHNSADQGGGGAAVRNTGGLFGWGSFGYNYTDGLGGGLHADRSEDADLTVPLRISGSSLDWNVGLDGAGFFAKGPPLLLADEEADPTANPEERMFIIHSWNNGWESNTVTVGPDGSIVRTEGQTAFEGEDGTLELTIGGNNIFVGNVGSRARSEATYVRWDYTVDGDLNQAWRIGRPVAGGKSMLTQVRFGIVSPADQGCPGWHLHGGASGIEHWGGKGAAQYQWWGPYADEFPENCGYGRVYGGGFGAEPSDE